MISKKTISVLCIYITAASSSIDAKTIGTKSFEALNIPIGSREISMGAASAVASPQNAFWWNPARLSLLERSTMHVMYNQWLLDITQQTAGVSFPMPKNNCGSINIYMLTIGGIDGYSWQDVPTGTVLARDFYVSYSQAKKVSNHLSIGITMKGILEELDDTRAFALAFDAGIMIVPPFMQDVMWISGGVKNFGDGTKFIDIKEKLPMSFFGGVGLRINRMILLSTDAYLIDSELKFSVGGELNIWQILFFRAGWNGIADVDEKFRFGAGWNVGRFQIDYAYAPFSELGTTQRVDVAVEFGKLPVIEQMYRRGKKFFKTKQYDFAWLEFNKIAALDPKYKQVQKWLEKTIYKIRAIERGEIDPNEDKKKKSKRNGGLNPDNTEQLPETQKEETGPKEIRHPLPL